MYQHILIATDGSQAAEKAVSHGLELARLCGARVTAVAVHAPFRMIAVAPEVIVATPPDYAATAKTDADGDLQRVAKAADAAGISCQTHAIEHEQAAVAIVEAAKTRGCDLIVIPSRGRRGVTALLLGSLTMEVVSHATVPVLVLR